MHIGHRARHISPHLRVRHGKERVDAVSVRCAGAERHQGVHIGRSVDESSESADEELLIDYHDGRRQKKLDQPHRHMVARQNFRDRPVPHHMPHREIHQRNQEAQGGDQSTLHPGRLPVFQRVLRLRCRYARPARILFT